MRAKREVRQLAAALEAHHRRGNPRWPAQCCEEASIALQEALLARRSQIGFTDCTRLHGIRSTCDDAIRDVVWNLFPDLLLDQESHHEWLLVDGTIVDPTAGQYAPPHHPALLLADPGDPLCQVYKPHRALTRLERVAPNEWQR